MQRRCARCGQRTKMTEHHVLPRRIWPVEEGNTEVGYLCRDCHDEIERIIAYRKRQVLKTNEEMYRRIWQNFIRGVN